MRTPYFIEQNGSHFKDYYRQQAGGSINVFSGAPLQKGHGIGGLFSGLIKGALPLLKQGAKKVGREILGSGINIAKDLMQGKNLKNSAKKNFSNAGMNILDNLSSSLSSPKRGVASRKRKAPQKKIKQKAKKPRRKVTTDIFT